MRVVVPWKAATKASPLKVTSGGASQPPASAMRTSAASAARAARATASGAPPPARRRTGAGSALARSGTQWTASRPHISQRRRADEGPKSGVGPARRASRSRHAAAERPWLSAKVALRARAPGASTSHIFSTTATTGTSTSSKSATPLTTSAKARRDGVVTTTAASMARTWLSVSCASPVPGGQSTTNASRSRHATEATSC
mmetsp:Transcript_27330/g.81989  ORF Transcript_27330/g.81989 Transcript_27330/m.81989 type:complete len:201 (+) Transcript_27330:249-851(+)